MRRGIRGLVAIALLMMLSLTASASEMEVPNISVTAHLTTVDIYSELPADHPDGYQIKYRKATGKWKTVYSFKMRSYKRVNGKKHYSKWSKTKSVKTNKRYTTYKVGKGIRDKQYIYCYGNCEIYVKNKNGKKVRTLEQYGVNGWAQYVYEPGDSKVVVKRNNEAAEFSLSEVPNGCV